MNEHGLGLITNRNNFAKNFFSIINCVLPESVETNEKKRGIPPILALAKPDELSLLKSVKREIQEDKDKGKVMMENELLRSMNHEIITPHSIEFEKDLMGFAKQEVVKILNDLQRISNERKKESKREVDEYEALKNNPFNI